MKKILINILLIPLILTACMDVVEVELETEDTFVVVEGEINNLYDRQFVEISLSQPYFSNSGKVAIENAMVLLLEDGEEILEYEELGDGKYAIDFKGEVGKHYAVQVLLPELEGYPEFAGQLISSKPERLAPVTEITGLYSNDESHIFHEEGFHVYTSTYDMPGKGDCYRWKLEVNGEISPDPRYLVLMDDELIDGNDINDLMVSFKPLQKQDRVTLYQQSLTRNYYHFLLSISTQAVNQEGIFDTPGYNPESNLVSDIPVVGYFNASAYSVASIVVGE